MGLFFALGGDLMFFVALVSVFFVNKSSGHFDAYSHWVNEWLPTAIPSILWLNTAVLLLSSVTGEMARRSMFRCLLYTSHAGEQPGLLCPERDE